MPPGIQLRRPPPRRAFDRRRGPARANTAITPLEQVYLDVHAGSAESARTQGIQVGGEQVPFDEVEVLTGQAVDALEAQGVGIGEVTAGTRVTALARADDKTDNGSFKNQKGAIL